MSFRSVSAAAPRLKTRAREAGSFAVVLAFVGTLALAPFSIASAQANAAAQPEPTVVAQMPHGQRLVAADADEQVTSLDSMSVTPAPAVQTAEVSSSETEDSVALYTLQQFMFSGVVNWGGYKFTFYSQQVLPGGGLQIPGRHVSDAGYVTDADGYIVLAGSAPKGTVYATPFGAPGKIYDRGTVGNHLDVYIR